MDANNLEENDWTDEDSVVAQALANYLHINVAGFQPSPKDQPEADEAKTIPYMPDLDAEIFRNNLRIMRAIILSGLIHGDPDQQQEILSSIQADHFWDKSFDKYLFEVIAQQIKQKGQISVQEIQDAVPNHAVVVYGYAPNRRELFGSYYNWAQILKMQPTWAQVLQSIELMNRLKKP